MKKSGWWFWAVLAVLATFSCCFCLLPPFGEFAFQIAGGWVIFLVSVVPEIHFSWSGIATACLCLVLLAWGLHRFFQWLYGHCRRSEQSPPTWSRRWTLSLLGAIVVMFVAGLAVVGMIHQRHTLLRTGHGQ